RIASLLFEKFPDGDGILHANDGRVGKKLITLPLMSAAYYRRFGWIYNPCYTSLFCDEEFMLLSESLGRAAYFDDVIIAHQWIGEKQPDQLHQRNESFYQSDGRLFEER